MPPYQFGNPANDFYIRQAQSLSQQQPQFVPQPQHFQPQPQPLNFPAPQNQARPTIIASVVTNIEEAKATRIEPMTAYVFIDTSCGKMYFKQLANDGTSSFTTFVQEQPTVQEQAQNPVEQSMSMLDRRLANIEAMIGEMKNGKPVSDAQSVQTEPDELRPTADVAENGKTEPPAFSKGNGHGWRQK